MSAASMPPSACPAKGELDSRARSWAASVDSQFAQRVDVEIVLLSVGLHEAEPGSAVPEGEFGPRAPHFSVLAEHQAPKFPERALVDPSCLVHVEEAVNGREKGCPIGLP